MLVKRLVIKPATKRPITKEKITTKTAAKIAGNAARIMFNMFDVGPVTASSSKALSAAITTGIRMRT
jgi:hypothetical protein